MSIASLLFSFKGIGTVDWRSYMETARAYPFSAGLSVTLMLFTTFFPTLLHLAIGIGATCSAAFPSFAEAAKLIPADASTRLEGTDAEKVARAIFKLERLWIFGLPPAAILLFLLGLLFNATFEPLGTFLYDTAMCSTRWEHGQCPSPFYSGILDHFR